METSAKASINVEDAFFTLARDIKAKMEKKLVRFLLWYIRPIFGLMKTRTIALSHFPLFRPYWMPFPFLVCRR
jgi:hypothetical protein